MNHKILIVDDDYDFRTLLSDLYIQADYQVEAVSNPLNALRVLGEESFDLCVTDQAMPELKGVDFINKCRKINPRLPIIMVSAYLNDELTNKLHMMRIEVFHKPLNIMSLLRKTSELIKNAANLPDTLPETTEVFTDSVIDTSNRAGSGGFRSFALKSDASKRLKLEIESIGSELPNLVMVGDEGTHFRSICEDIEAQVIPDKHHFMYFTNPKINVFDISKMIAGQPASKTLVFVLTEAFCLGVAQKHALLKLYKKTGPFASVINTVKFIFCLNEDLDTQFAKGVIDEDFYLILGQKEIYIPSLNLCKEDIPYLASDIATELIKSKTLNTTFGGFSAEAADLLCDTNWEKNYESLREVVASALSLAGGISISVSILTQAITNPLKVNISDKNDAEPVAVQIHDPKTNIVSRDRPKVTTTLQAPKVNSAAQRGKSPNIQSFPMLDDEIDLARSILNRAGRQTPK
jgi:two-component system, response regulator, stage 0 sporulation protein F